MEPVKAENTVHVAGWEPAWQDMSFIMHHWEPQIQDRARKFHHFDPQKEVDEEIDDSIEAIESINLELSRSKRKLNASKQRRRGQSSAQWRTAWG